MTPVRICEQGFTLAELLVAIFVFGLIAAASGSTLTLALDTADSLDTQNAALRAETRARALIKADMLQATPRPARGAFGTQTNDAFLGGTATGDERILMQFSRNGWINPGRRLARGNTQRVEYILRGGDLIRRFPLRVDPAPETEIREQLLFTGVRGAAVEFHSRGNWLTAWRSAGFLNARLPEAMRLTLRFDDGSERVQLFLITGRAQ